MAILLLFTGLVSVGGHALQTTEAGLPEDTFRRLAAVLYSRGDKEENRLTRKFLYNRNVTCNDGSPAGYYIRRNPPVESGFTSLRAVGTATTKCLAMLVGFGCVP